MDVSVTEQINLRLYIISLSLIYNKLFAVIMAVGGNLILGT